MLCGTKREAAQAQPQPQPQQEPKRRQLPEEIKQVISHFAKRNPLEKNGRAIRIAFDNILILIDYYDGFYRVWSSCKNNNIAKFTNIDSLLSSTDEGIDWKHIEIIVTLQTSALSSSSNQRHNWTMDFIGEEKDFGKIRDLLEKWYTRKPFDVEIHFVRKLQDTDGREVQIKSQQLNTQHTIIVQVYQTISKCFCIVSASIETDEDEEENEVSLTIKTCFNGDILPQLAATTKITIKEFPLSTLGVHVENTQDSQILEQFKTFLELTARQIYDGLTHHGTFYRISEHPAVCIKNHDAECMIRNFLSGTNSNSDNFTE